MTNYNDGKWHGWNGGEMPVHGDSLVDVLFLEEDAVEDTDADSFDWDCINLPIAAFRVTKEHKEPREFWVCPATDCTFDDVSDKFVSGYIHVREVIE